MANFMLIPQAWSLGIEEAFYLISPFYVRLSSGLLAALFLAGLAFVHWAPLTGAMVLARSFPLSCFTVFAGGILAFRLAERWKAAAGDERFRRWAPWAVAALALSLALIPWSAWSPELRRVLLLAILIPCLPFLMVLSEGAAWDRFLGGYSYPLYVGHLLASTLAIVFGPEAENPWVWSLLALLITLALRHGVEKPLEPLRRRLREGLRRGA